ncbi:hypothetical protein BJ508DRAFT_327568 [Ascobolus immersus RN42]|uniref:Uncharacterized protein n=1 Tax=Ascobolus immersus RN42 TaxID=1160509 RepID=A0A3N4I2N4_ASCIM|nr:hypothetical protein BJ508DRAFT_327568 [Ascobolus immersus RN42]
MTFEGRSPKLYKVSDNLRIALHSSEDQGIWTQLQAPDWNDIGVRRYNAVKFLTVTPDQDGGDESTGTAMRITSSANFDPDGHGSQTRMASHVCFYANTPVNAIHRSRRPAGSSRGDLVRMLHIGEVVYFFDLESRIPLQQEQVAAGAEGAQGPGARMAVLFDHATVKSLALVKSMAVKDDHGLRYVEMRGGNHIVVPASAVSELIGYVYKGGRRYITESRGGCDGELI